jgi:uncharacterized protein (TIGR03067 family)
LSATPGVRHACADILARGAETVKPIRWTLAVLSAIALAGLGAAGDKSDADQIAGTWRFAGLLEDGKDMPAELRAVARMTFTKDGKATFTMADQTNQGSFKVAGPGQIDLDLGKKRLEPGIYKLEGKDRLTICLSKDAKKRPTELTGAAGSGQVLIQLTRAKPGEEKPSKEDLAKFGGGFGKIKGEQQGINNLKQIGLAMHNYHDTYNAFPLHAIYSKDGKTPMLSWRVAILPYVEEIELYRQFKLDEPWDSANNKKLVARMPKLYAAGGPKDGDGMTHYQVVTGPGTPFDGSKKVGLRDLVAGSANTIMVVEAKDPVIWSKPADLTLPKDKGKLPALGGLRKEGFYAVLFDGSATQFRDADATAARLRPMMLLKGKE